MSRSRPGDERSGTTEEGPLQGLADLVAALRSSRRFLDVLEIAAEQAMAAIGADSLSLSEWDRDLGRLVTRVNVGRLAPGEQRFPEDEVYVLAHDQIVLLQSTGFLVQADDAGGHEPDRSILVGAGMASGLTMPVPSEGHLWGEMWATRSPRRPAYQPSDLPLASRAAALVGEVVASAELLERTARLAYEDPLTRLANRRVFDDRLAALLEPGGPGATVVLCDLDDLKAINDAWGHDAGDRVISLAADALSVVASRADGCVAARVGGDEFALVLPGDARAHAVGLARRAVALLGRGEHAPSMSCGVASAPPGCEPRSLFVTVDAALYGAKHRGAQLLLSSDLADADHEIVGARPSRAPSAGRRRWDDATDRPYAADAAAAVADAVQALADGLADAPKDVAGALRWVGTTVMGPLDLDRWVLSQVRPMGDGDDRIAFALDSLGLRRARLTEDPAPQDEADIASEVRPVDEYPAAAAAVKDGSVFAFERVEGTPDIPSPGATALLERYDMRFLVGTGAAEDGQEWLLTLYGSQGHIPLSAIREVVALARAAAIREDDLHG
ncbi:MAG: diguanylate cyclase domain-containing protein [Actinomycetales bacterium]